MGRNRRASRYQNYLCVWRRQPGGAWRVFIDVGANAPQPVPFVPGFTRFPFGARYAALKTRPRPRPCSGRPRAQRPSRNGRREATREVLAEASHLHRRGFVPPIGRAAAEKWMAGRPPRGRVDRRRGVPRSGDLGYSYGSPGERRPGRERRVRARLDPRRGGQAVRRGGRDKTIPNP